METDTALVRANGVVVLDTVTHVRLNVTLVVDPVHAELYHPVRHTETLDEVVAVEFRMFVVLFLDCAQHLGDGLDVLRLSGNFSWSFSITSFAFII